MNKKYLYLITAIFLIVVFYFQQEIKSNTLYIFNQTKSIVFDYLTFIKEGISTHFNQAEQIKLLKQKNKKYTNYIASIQPKIDTCKKLQNFKYIKNPKVTFTQTISYAKLPDITSIYIDYFEKNLTIPRGLIYNNQAAGIVIKSIKNFSLVYLNNNPKTSYTVFIGKDKIPGILFGGDKVIIKYIPKYHPIKKGDRVITSGLDHIFYEGIDVGVITNIIQKKLYQEAIIEPFYNPLHPTFFYVVRN